MAALKPAFEQTKQQLQARVVVLETRFRAWEGEQASRVGSSRAQSLTEPDVSNDGRTGKRTGVLVWCAPKIRELATALCRVSAAAGA